MTKEVEDEVEDEAMGVVEAVKKVIDKLKMKKEVPTTLHVVEAAERIGTISIIIIMANMVITQVNAIPKKRWRGMLIL
jgi:hypothetical protein